MSDEDVGFEEGESLIVDLNEVEDDAGFEAMPRGMYEATVSECEFKYSNSSGNPMWALKWEVSDGDFAGRILFSHMVWKGKGLPITKKHLSRLRPDLLEAPFNPEDDEIIESMIGLNGRLKVTVKKYEGNMTNNVQDIHASDGVTEEF